MILINKKLKNLKARSHLVVKTEEVPKVETGIQRKELRIPDLGEEVRAMIGEVAKNPGVGMMKRKKSMWMRMQRKLKRIEKEARKQNPDQLKAGLRKILTARIQGGKKTNHLF